jgi:hypothetical protein
MCGSTPRVLGVCRSLEALDRSVIGPGLALLATGGVIDDRSLDSQALGKASDVWTLTLNVLFTANRNDLLALSCLLASWRLRIHARGQRTRREREAQQILSYMDGAECPGQPDKPAAHWDPAVCASHCQPRSNTAMLKYIDKYLGKRELTGETGLVETTRQILVSLSS